MVRKSVILLLVLVAATGSVMGMEKEILRVGMQNDPITLNPFRARDVWSWNVLGLIYDSLYGYSPDLELIPMIAEGFPEYDEEAGTATVHLKEGVKWSDGTDLLSEDVVFTAEVIQHFKFPTLYYRFEFITKVETIDEHTVRYHFDTEYLGGGRTPIFESDTLTTFVVQEAQWRPIFEKALEKRDPLGWFWAEQPEPVGNGPFIFKEWMMGSYLYLVRNKDYYATGTQVDGRKVGPYINGILFSIYRTTDLASLALKKGELDYIWWSIPPGFIEGLEKDPDVIVHRNKSNGFFYLAFNLRREPWDDKALRRALNYLIDREVIAGRILWDYGEPVYTVVPPGNEYWHNPAVPTYGKGLSGAEGLAQARQILAEAGYSWKDGELLLPGEREAPPLEILVPPADYDPLRDKAAGLITVWFNGLGLKVQKRNVSFAALVYEVFDKRKFDAYVLGWSLSPDPDHVRVFFHSGYDEPGGFNCTGYSDPEFDRLATESMLAMDRARRREVIFEMQQALMEDLPYLPLYSFEIIEAHSRRVEGWVDQLGGIGNHWSFVFLRARK